METIQFSELKMLRWRLHPDREHEQDKIGSDIRQLVRRIGLIDVYDIEDQTKDIKLQFKKLIN